MKYFLKFLTHPHLSYMKNFKNTFYLKDITIGHFKIIELLKIMYMLLNMDVKDKVTMVISKKLKRVKDMQIVLSSSFQNPNYFK